MIIVVDALVGENLGFLTSEDAQAGVDLDICFVPDESDRTNDLIPPRVDAPSRHLLGDDDAEPLGTVLRCMLCRLKDLLWVKGIRRSRYRYRSEPTAHRTRSLRRSCQPLRSR